MTRLVMRAPMAARPPTVRRSASVVGEVRIYQELIRLAVMRQRLLSQRARGSQEAPKELAALDQYRDDLYRRLGLCNITAVAAKRTKAMPVAEAPNGTGEAQPAGGITAVQELRYCHDR